MSKQDAERKKKDEEKELDEEQDEEQDDEESEDEDEGEEDRAASAAPVGRARPRARRAHDDHRDDAAHGDGDGHGHGHGHDEDEEESDADDPYWWTPHAVMSALVLLGVLGFFGAFNRFVPKGFGGVAAAKEHTETTTAAAAHSPTPAAKPATPPGSAETYGAKHLLVQYKGSMRAAPTITRTEEEAKARATEAMKKARGGAKFEDVVKEYSDEPGADKRGGDLGTFRKGQMVPEFQTAVEKLKVGQVSDLVKTPFGYHVIIRTQ